MLPYYYLNKKGAAQDCYEKICLTGPSGVCLYTDDNGFQKFLSEKDSYLSGMPYQVKIEENSVSENMIKIDDQLLYMLLNDCYVGEDIFELYQRQGDIWRNYERPEIRRLEKWLEKAASAKRNGIYYCNVAFLKDAEMIISHFSLLQLACKCLGKEGLVPVYINIYRYQSHQWINLKQAMDALKKLGFNLFFVEASKLGGDMIPIVTEIIKEQAYIVFLTVTDSMHISILKDNHAVMLEDISFIFYGEYKRMYPKQNLEEYISDGGLPSGENWDRGGMWEDTWAESISGFIQNNASMAEERYPNLVKQYWAKSEEYRSYDVSKLITGVMKAFALEYVINNIENVFRDIRFRFTNEAFEDDLEIRRELRVTLKNFCRSRLRIHLSKDEEEVFCELKELLKEYMFGQTVFENVMIMPSGLEYKYINNLICEVVDYKLFTMNFQEPGLKVKEIGEEITNAVRGGMLEKVSMLHLSKAGYSPISEYIDPQIYGCRIYVSKGDFAVDFQYTMNIQLNKCLWLVFCHLSGRIKVCENRLFVIYLGGSLDKVTTFAEIVDSIGIEIKNFPANIQELYYQQGTKPVMIHYVNAERLLLKPLVLMN